MVDCLLYYSILATVDSSSRPSKHIKPLFETCNHRKSKIVSANEQAYATYMINEQILS